MARFKTTENDLATFEALCDKWLSNLGIKSYVTSYRRTSMGSLAAVVVRVNTRSARFMLATSWSRAVTMLELEGCALHECLHVLMAQLVAEALPNGVEALYPADPGRVDREEEAVVVTLENVLTRLAESKWPQIPAYNPDWYRAQ